MYGVYPFHHCLIGYRHHHQAIVPVNLRMNFVLPHAYASAGLVTDLPIRSVHLRLAQSIFPRYLYLS